jgi:hypothetical protein
VRGSWRSNTPLRVGEASSAVRPRTSPPVSCSGTWCSFRSPPCSPRSNFFLGMEAHDPMYGSQAAYFSELFGTQLCYSGASIGYQLASVVGRHLAAHRQIAARVRGGGHWWPVAT